VDELRRAVEAFLIEREGPDALARIGADDLLNSGWLDSLDLVELAQVVSEAGRVQVDLSNESHFTALRSIPSLLDFFRA
jgi:acyl carrier protein